MSEQIEVDGYERIASLQKQVDSLHKRIDLLNDQVNMIVLCCGKLIEMVDPEEKKE